MRKLAVTAMLMAAFFAPGALAATPDPDGRYRGTHVGKGGKKLTQTISFQMSSDGRRITGLRTTATTFCVGPTLFDNRIFIVPVSMPAIRVRANGRFKGVLKPLKRSKIEVSGRRRGGRVAGRIEVKVANCAGRDDFVARLVGP